MTDTGAVSAPQQPADPRAVRSQLLDVLGGFLRTQAIATVAHARHPPESWAQWFPIGAGGSSTPATPAESALTSADAVRWYHRGTERLVPCVPIVSPRGRWGRRGRAGTHSAVRSSGWGPGGRRFKSCLPDLARAPFLTGLSVFLAPRPRRTRPLVVPAVVPGPGFGRDAATSPLTSGARRSCSSSVAGAPRLHSWSG